MNLLLFSIAFAVSSVNAFRTSLCVEKNEEFSLCAWRCPPTCVNIRLLTEPAIFCPYKWECVVGCRCSPGYIRDEYSHKCLPVWQCPGVASVVGAPLSPGQLPQEASYSDQHHQILREKRSSYPAAYYAPSPCASAHVPTYIAPVHHAAYGPAIPAVQHYGYGLPLSPYREADEQEMMSFSDMDNPQQMMMTEQFVPNMEHLTMARYAYGAPAVPIAAPLPALASAASAHVPAISAAPSSAAPAIGVFPGATTGGCSVPLLLTCSPSIRSGHIVQAHPYDEAYRGVDESNFHEGSFHEGQEPLTHEELNQSVVSPHDAAPSSIQRHQ